MKKQQFKLKFVLLKDSELIVCTVIIDKGVKGRGNQLEWHITNRCISGKWKLGQLKSRYAYHQGKKIRGEIY